MYKILVGIPIGMIVARITKLIETPLDNLNDWLTLAVAAWALIYTAKQAEISREHNRLSVRPYITTQANRAEEEKINFEIVNKGLGPAIITRMLFNIEYNGVITEDASLGKLVETCGIPDLKTTGYTPNAGYCVAAGEKIELVSFEPPVEIETEVIKEKRHANELYFIDNVEFKINYTSMYEEESHTLETKYCSMCKKDKK